MSKQSPVARSTAISSGAVCVLLGFATYLLSRGRDGFDKGLFIGMTVAFMVLGAYLLASSARGARHGTDAESDSSGMWLPSRDDRP